MNRESFDKYLNLYGSQLDLWPEEIRDEALQALRSSAEFQRRLEEEQSFENILSSVESPQTSADLAGRIVSASQNIRQKTRSGSEKNGVWKWLLGMWAPKPAFALASLLILGFIVGFWAGGSGMNQTSANNLASIYNDGELSWVSQLNSSY